jgi:ADP-ribose pyrophosphatase YjhB (NUDIX family)
MSKWNKDNRMIVGVNTLLFWQNKILLAERLGKNHYGYYGCPGGKLDFGESPIECSRRETEEETSLKVKNLRLLSFVSNRIVNDNHYLYLHCSAFVDKPKDWDGTVDFIEYDKHGDPKNGPWLWYTRKELDKLKIIASIKEAWDYYINRPGVPYAELYHVVNNKL